MSYTPAFDPSIETALSPKVETLPLRTSVATRRAPLRFGGYTMDTATGAVRWLGQTLDLAVQDRQLLATFLRNAGRILSRERLSALAGIPAAAVDARVASLSDALRAQGISATPRWTEGVGYILWR